MNAPFQSIKDIKVGMIVCRVDGAFQGMRAEVKKSTPDGSVYIEIDQPDVGIKACRWYGHTELAPFGDIGSVYAREQFTNINQVVVGMKVFRIDGPHVDRIATVDSVKDVIFVTYDDNGNRHGYDLLSLVSAYPLTKKVVNLAKDDDPDETRCRTILTSIAIDPYTCGKCGMPKPNGGCKWHPGG